METQMRISNGFYPKAKFLIQFRKKIQSKQDNFQIVQLLITLKELALENKKKK